MNGNESVARISPADQLRQRQALAACVLAAALLLVAGVSLTGCRNRTPGPPATPTASSLEAEGVAALSRPALPARGPGLASLAVFPTSDVPLSLLGTQPKDGAVDVTTARDGTQIAVRFNHPVIAAAFAGADAEPESPIEIAPALTGKGHWLGTSTYVFEPTEDLAGATRYVVTVKPSLTDALGSRLAGGGTFGFTTAAPAVVATDPVAGSAVAGPTQVISATFNQAMDQGSVEAAFRLAGAVAPAAVSGSFQWRGNTVVFRPAAPLERGQAYQASIAATAKAARGGAALASGGEWTFTVAERPHVVGTVPVDGAVDSPALRDGAFLITFSVPMKTDGLTVTIQPTITSPSVWWEADDRRAHVTGGWLASTAYTVTVPAGTKAASGDEFAESVTVRFSTAPMQPWFALQTAGDLGLHSAGRPQTVYLEAVNEAAVTLTLHALTVAELLSVRLGDNAWQAWQNLSPPAEQLVRSWSVDTGAAVDVTRRVSTTLAAGGESLPPGAYLLRASGQQRYVAVVSDLNLTLKYAPAEVLVWATQLGTGQPVAGVPVAVYDSTTGPLVQGVTGADGVFRGQLAAARQDPWSPLLALSIRDGQIRAAVGSDWSEGVDPWSFNLNYDPTVRQVYADLYTDRPIYRTAQTVYYRAVLRADRDAVYDLPTFERARLIVRDPNGDTVQDTTLPLDSFGALNGQVTLSAEARLGQYTIELSRADSAAAEGNVGPQVAQVTFQVAAYRKPEFEVSVTTDRPWYLTGDTVKTTVSASYYFGGAVAGAKVHWRLLTDDYFFQPNVEGWWDFIDYDLTEQRYYNAQAEVVTEGDGVLDGDGSFTFEVPADLSEVPLAQVYTLDAEVTDINNEVVAGRTSAAVHKSDVYVGLQPVDYVGAAGRPMDFNVLVLDPNGQPVGGQSVALSFMERTWFSVKEKREDGSFYWTSHYTDTLQAKDSVTSDAQGKARATFTPPSGGVYRLAAQARDSAGRVAQSATYVWIAGSGYINWRQENNLRLDLVADRKSYEPGQTAAVLVPAPFVPCRALLTVERGGIREVQVLRLTSNSQTVPIPIRADYVPNVYVSVVLVKEGAAGSVSEIEVGYTNLAVSAQGKKMAVSATTDRPGPFGPGDTVTYTVHAADAAGKPVVAEFSAALVDKALLALTEDTSVPLADAFYSQRALAVATAASLVRSADRANAELAAEKKGGGGGLTEAGTVRRLFRDTAFWDGALVTDSQGQAEIGVTLPDNLTTWHLDLRGVTGADTLVGSGSLDIVSTKPVLVRPVLPRFLVAGDTTQLETVVNNATEKTVDLEVSLAVAGLAKPPPPSQRLSVAAGGRAKVVWQVEVSAERLQPSDAPGAMGQVTVQMAAAGDGYEDAVELPVPVYPFADPETVAMTGEVADASVTEQFRLPQDAVAGLGELAVDVAGSLAGVSMDGLRWLTAYPYECSEQTASKLLANVAIYDALAVLAGPGNSAAAAPKAALEEARAGADRLYALQNGDGSWGWWGTDGGRPDLTAYALLALVRGRAAGLPVNSDALDSATTYLLGQLDLPFEGEGALDIEDRTFVLFVLSELGDLAPSRAVAAYEHRSGLGPRGLAFLALALSQVAGDQRAQVDGLLAELGAASSASASGAYWTEPDRGTWSLGGDDYSTAVAVLALVRLDPQNPLLAPAVRWLIAARDESRWQTTQSTAWAIQALTEQMQSTGELKADFTYNLELDSLEMIKGRFNRANLAQPVTAVAPMSELLAAGLNSLVFRKDGPGVLYYSALVRAYRSAETLPATDNGFVIGRQYFMVDPSTFEPVAGAIDRAAIGDLVQAKLTLVVPEESHYVVVEDPIPAGFEIVDTSLRTTTAAATSPEFAPQEEPSGPESWWEREWWGYWVDSELLDQKVALFATALDPGTYDYTYLLRADVAGNYRVVPAHAEEMYRPEVFGRSAGGVFTVEAP